VVEETHVAGGDGSRGRGDSRGAAERAIEAIEGEDSESSFKDVGEFGEEVGVRGAVGDACDECY